MSTRFKWAGSRRKVTPALASNEELVRLPDGRRVAITFHGDPQGDPVFFFHGFPISRVGWEFADAPARERGVRVLCPDRPGIGRSDPKPDRTIPGYAEDIGALADTLGIGRFAVVGHSCGAPYALACGAMIPERVRAVATMGGVGPLDRPGARTGLSKTDIQLIDLSLRRPLLARVVLTSFGRLARYAPSMVAKSQADGLHETDLRYVEERVRQRGQNDIMNSVDEAFRQGGGGMVLEYRLWELPWGFSLEQVSPPVHIFHGEVDQMVPLHHAEDLTARVPHATLSVLPGTGHLSIMGRFGSILDALATE